MEHWLSELCASFFERSPHSGTLPKNKPDK